MAKERRKRKISWKKIICGILAVIVIIACIGGISSCFKKDNTKTISSTAFTRGGLDENGEYVETKKTLYTEDMFGCEGLVITPDFDAQMSFQVYFYNIDGIFLERSSVTDKITRYNVPESALYARVMLIPDSEEDIGVLEQYSLAKKVKVTVAKEQNMSLYDYYEVDQDNLGKVVTYYNENNKINYITNFEVAGYTALKPITVTGWKNVLCIFDEDYPSDNKTVYFFTDAEGLIVPSGTHQQRYNNGETYVIIAVPEGATTFYANTLNTDEYSYKIHKYN